MVLCYKIIPSIKTTCKLIKQGDMFAACYLPQKERGCIVGKDVNQHT